MFTERQLLEIKNKIDQNIVLFEAVGQVIPNLYRDRETMNNLKLALFILYPESEPKVQKLRIQHKISKLKNIKQQLTDPDQIVNIDMEITRLNEMLKDLI